ncbi:antitoxin Xre/MbcA/ParS toxin-binding domain-containing protein [Spirosoma arcticum]
MEPPKDITPEILYQTGMEVFEDFDAYANWLNSKIPNLGGRKPSSLVHTEAGRGSVITCLWKSYMGFIYNNLTS